MILALVAAAALFLVVGGAAPQSTFKARIDSVRLDVLVTAGGQPVRGLTAADFDVRDNGVRQSVRVIEAGSLPLDVILAVDMSSSLAADRLEALKRAGTLLTDALQRGDRAALLTFSHAARVRQPLTADLSLVRRALRDAAPAGTTALVDAVYAAIGMAEAGERRTLLLVFSDGIDTISWLPPDAVFRAAERGDVVVYGVSTASASQTPAVLRDLTARTGGKLFEVDSRRLPVAFTGVLEEFRERYLLSYALPSSPAPGWHRIQVRVNRPAVMVRARDGYLVPPRQQR